MASCPGELERGMAVADIWARFRRKQARSGLFIPFAYRRGTAMAAHVSRSGRF